MMTRRRWIAGGGLLTLTYLVLGAIHAVDDPGLPSAAVYLVTAVATFGLAAAVLPVVAPRRRGPDGGRRDYGDDGPGPGGDPPPPQWWPDFERDFWSHLSGDRDPADGRRRETAGTGGGRRA